jgi:uncharacterized protein YecE (DUF72 family)
VNPCGEPTAIRVGCAGWSIPTPHAHRLPGEGRHLARYAAVFPAVEIDSSFYRLHRESTYLRWAASVPEAFRFSVKIPREITHRGELRPSPLFEEFLVRPQALGARLGPLLVQLPPKLALDLRVGRAFFSALRERFQGALVCEPRHPSWFSPEAGALLAELCVARAAADPAVVPEAAEPGGDPGLAYFRLHGSPERYRSAYPEVFLARLVARLRRESVLRPVWCIFDNTAAGAAIPNALWVQERLARPRPRVPREGAARRLQWDV